jgi:hypothetical protein
MRNWTAQRMETLKAMWTEGKSSTQISQALGGVSRNAVMGKVDRMGLMRSAIHNMRMVRTPLGACRKAMIGLGRGRPTSSGHMQSDPVAEEVVPVPAFVVAEIDIPGPLASFDMPPETIVPVDVLDVLPGEPVLLQSSDVSEVIPPEFAPETITLVDAPTAASTAPVTTKAAVAKPKRTVSDLAKALKESKTATAVRAHAERASRPWKGPMTSTVRSAPREPAAFSMPPKGLMDRVRIAAGGVGDVDHRTAVAFVKEMGDGMYDATRRAHQAALVAIATVLARGDPRRILVPFMPEPHVLQMMRGLAEKAIVVAGKPPERWADAETGDRAFFDDVLAVEGPLRMDVIGYRRAA